MRTYWILSQLASALASTALVAALLRAEAHPAQTGAQSWGQARLALLGLAVVAALALNAVAADAAAVLRGLVRPVLAALLAAGAVLGAAAAAWLVLR